VKDEELQERKEIISDFVSESRDMLDNAEPKIIEMEKKAQSSGTVDPEVLYGVFRLFHSFKGTASFLDLPIIVSVTHEAETLLDLFRKGKSIVKPEYVDILCVTADFLRSILDNLQETLTDAGRETEAEAIITKLKGHIKIINFSPETNSVKSVDDVPKPIVEKKSADDSMKIEITPQKADIKLSMPTVVTGGDYSTKILNGEKTDEVKIRVVLDCENEKLFVKYIFQGELNIA
jgi:chemotaxis protein histidine kinase CheA